VGSSGRGLRMEGGRGGTTRATVRRRMDLGRRVP